jgi:hypothetical protein
MKSLSHVSVLPFWAAIPLGAIDGFLCVIDRNEGSFQLVGRLEISYALLGSTIP